MDARTRGTEVEGWRSIATPNPLRDVFLVGSPIVVLGVAGSLLGPGTLAGGAIVNLGYVLAIVLGGYLLRRQGSGWRAIGLARPPSRVKTILSGVGAGVGAVVVFVAVQVVVPAVLVEVGVTSLPGIDQSRFNRLEGNLPLFVLMVGLAWTTIAFGEELFYRAFLVSRLVDHAGFGAWTAILLAGSAFGAVHVAEGPVGVLANGAFGVLFGWIYVRTGRNLWITVVGHGLINTLRFWLLYVGAV